MAESGEIFAKQILAQVAVRVCMCMLISENNVRVACCSACSWPRSADYKLSSRAYFKAGTILASSHDFLPRGGLKYQNLVKGPGVPPDHCARTYSTAHKRFLFGTSSCKVSKYSQWTQVHTCDYYNNNSNFGTIIRALQSLYPLPFIKLSSSHWTNQTTVLLCLEIFKQSCLVHHSHHISC